VESRLPPPVEVPVAEIPYDAEIPCEPPLYTLSFIAAGDNLFHISMLNSSLQDGEYNFSPIYTEVRNIVRQADIAFINQETVMAGSRQGYSGYPKFNTPSALAPVLVDAGFTVINHANNHVMDMGEAGILSTLDVWDSIPGVICLGIRRTNEFKPAVVTRNNISLGFLSYTFSTNYIPLPKDKPWMVSMTNRETIAAEIEAIRPLCDFLIVSAHWGDEYEREPNSFQTDLAAFLAARNVDMVIGHHPHVLQRAEYIDRPDGKQTLCFYSLGNFASNQDNKERLLGALSYVVIHKKEDRVSVGDAGLIPVVTHIEPGYTNTKVYPFYEYTDELMESHRLYTRDKNFNMAFYNDWLASLNAKVFMYNPFVQDLP
jgi:poly-gamma-glutamate synthesis protein (capsule biosynthesis protein)